MKKIYDKNELHFALIWIGVYIVLMSVGDSVSGTIGIAKIVTAPVCIIFTLILYLWICKHKLNEKYGLCPFGASAKKYLYFVPLVLLASTNLWWGFHLNLTLTETVLYAIDLENHKNKTINPISGHKYSTCPSGRLFKGY